MYSDVRSDVRIEKSLSTEDIGKSFVLTADIYNMSEDSVQLTFYTKIGSSASNIKFVSVPTNEAFVNVSSTQLTIPEVDSIGCLITLSASETPKPCYLDNLSLIIQ